MHLHPPGYTFVCPTSDHGQSQREKYWRSHQIRSINEAGLAEYLPKRMQLSQAAWMLCWLIPLDNPTYFSCTSDLILASPHWSVSPVGERLHDGIDISDGGEVGPTLLDAFLLLLRGRCHSIAGSRFKTPGTSLMCY